MKIRHRSSVICIHENKILGFHAEDPSSHQAYFFLPGGKIEENEVPAVAATRETYEETGYQVEVLADQGFTSEYDFFWNGENHHCHTVYFPARLKNPSQAPVVVDDASYHRGVAWISVNEVDKIFAYSLPILESVRETVRILANFRA